MFSGLAVIHQITESQCRSQIMFDPYTAYGYGKLEIAEGLVYTTFRPSMVMKRQEML